MAHWDIPEKASDPEVAREMVLEEVADRLLAASLREGASGPYWFYTERGLKRRGEGEEHYPALELEELPAEASALQCALRTLTRSHVPPRHRLAFRLAARGYKHARIARMLGMNATTVRRWIGEICAELHGDLFGPEPPPREDREIREVLRADIGRAPYNDERHCKAGQEACRHSGQCVCRWYLHYLSE